MRRTTSAAMAVACVLAAATASVEGADLDVFGGYSLTQSDGEMFHGWNGALALALSERLAVEADLARHDGAPNDDDASFFSYMGGLRYSFPRGKTSFFVHALAGRVRVISTSSVPIFEFRVVEETKSTDLGLLVGAGVNHLVGERWGIRISADFLRIGADEALNQPRFSLGLTYRLE